MPRSSRDWEFMFAAKSKSARELFYERWKSAVFKFCFLVTSTESRAEESTARGFIQYLRLGWDICVLELPRKRAPSNAGLTA